ncbi:MAG: hypothetical protein K2K09_05485, partial [Lachnospiraceae bacterium]|nr:hypothetical protein [Lachnospiraceae bacterium]
HERYYVDGDVLLSWDELIAKINKTKELKNEENKISFSEAWNSLGTTGTEEENKALLEEKDRILELAEAGKLTKKELEKSSLAEIFEKSGVSIEEATKKINEMKSSASQLASMKTGISSISSILG